MLGLFLPRAPGELPSDTTASEPGGLKEAPSRYSWQSRRIFRVSSSEFLTAATLSPERDLFMALQQRAQISSSDPCGILAVKLVIIAPPPPPRPGSFRSRWSCTRGWRRWCPRPAAGRRYPRSRTGGCRSRAAARGTAPARRSGRACTGPPSAPSRCAAAASPGRGRRARREVGGEFAGLEQPPHVVNHADAAGAAAARAAVHQHGERLAGPAVPHQPHHLQQRLHFGRVTVVLQILEILLLILEVLSRAR